MASIFRCPRYANLSCAHAEVRIHRKIALCGSAFTILVGVAVLSGWIFGIDILKTVVPGFVNMKANTALSFISLGTAGLFLVSGRPPLPPRRRAIVIGIASVAIVTGALTLTTTSPRG